MRELGAYEKRTNDHHQHHNHHHNQRMGSKLELKNRNTTVVMESQRTTRVEKLATLAKRGETQRDMIIRRSQDHGREQRAL